MEKQKVVQSLESIAADILFRKATTDTFYGWTFRKGKTKEDIQKAIKKGLDPKKTFNKTEYEIQWVALYLGDVLKKVNLPAGQVEGEVVHAV